MDLHLREHVAVVVGGASGIGLASVEEFVREDVKVIIWDIASETETIAESVGAAAGYSVDISDEASVNAALEQTVAKFGRVDHVVHAAAIGSGKFGLPFTRLAPSDWKRVIDVNIQGMVNVAHAFATHMTPQGSGTMVFVASVAGQIGSPTDPPYSASKAAGINFVQVMAKDLASSGIRVNTVCPGMVKTPLNRSVWQSWQDRQPEENKLTYDEWAAQKIELLVPLNRWQRPEDVADMIVFLSSERACQITGQTINVDGGYVMHS